MEEALHKEMFGLTDRGQVREHNEDAICWDVSAGWVLLADGMGGHLAGEVASQLAIDTLEQALQQQFPGEGGADVEHALSDAVSEANRRIYDRARADAGCRNMGTTLVAGLFQQNALFCAHVGDSRLYRYRDGELVQLSRDHSLVQELVDEGMMSPEEARESRHKNVITRALGLEEQVEVELGHHTLQAGDIYLFCSDGLSDKLAASELAAGLQEGNLGQMAQHLLDEANARGGEDNISVILVRII